MCKLPNPYLESLFEEMYLVLECKVKTMLWSMVTTNQRYHNDWHVLLSYNTKIHTFPRKLLLILLMIFMFNVCIMIMTIKTKIICKWRMEPYCVPSPIADVIFFFKDKSSATTYKGETCNLRYFWVTDGWFFSTWQKKEFISGNDIFIKCVHCYTVIMVAPCFMKLNIPPLPGINIKDQIAI